MMPYSPAESAHEIHLATQCVASFRQTRNAAFCIVPVPGLSVSSPPRPDAEGDTVAETAAVYLR